MTGTDHELKEKLAGAIQAQVTCNNQRLASGPRNFTRAELLGVAELDSEIESIRTELASRKCHKRTSELRSQIAKTLEEMSKPKPRVCPPTPIHRGGLPPTGGNFHMPGEGIETRTGGNVSVVSENKEMTDMETEPTTIEALPEARWRDADGKEVRILNCKESMRAMLKERGDPIPDVAYPLGQAIVGRLTGKWCTEEFRTMAESINVLGGVLVPDAFSASVIDLARNISVCMTAGAKTVPMGTDTLSMARVTGDPTIAEKAENSAFVASDCDLDRLLFVAKTRGALVKASNELLADAPNAAKTIEMCLARAMATDIDELILSAIIASGEAETEAAVGAIAWLDLLVALEKVELNNAVANAYVCNPAIRYDLRALKSGDGANSAALWQGPPPGVDGLMPLTTNNIALANGILGDFRQILLAVRTGIEIKMSDVADDAFERYQSHIRLIWRGDVGLAHGNHFCNLTGITS